MARRLSRSVGFWLIIWTVVGAIALYAVRELLLPDPHTRSEQVVREFVRTAGKEVGGYRKEVRRLRREVKQGELAVEDAVAILEERADLVVSRIEERAEEAEFNVPDDIRARTQVNRIQRIGKKADEAIEMVRWVASDAASRVRPQAGSDAEEKASRAVTPGVR